MASGFSDHTIAGHIGSIREGSVGDKLVINVNVAVTPYQRGQTEPKTTWYETTLWGQKAEAFKKCNFEKGDLIHMKLDGLRAEAYLGQDGNPKAALKANVADFNDMRQRQTQGQKQSEPQSQQAVEAPKESAAKRSKMK